MTDTATPHAGDPTRRTVVRGLVGVGFAAPLVAACGNEDSGGAGGSSGSGGSGGDGGSTGGGTSSSGAVAQTADVPVGGGTILKSEKIVVTQPTEGDFKAFSAVCTHQGCPVSKIEGTEIECTCHGSKFSIEDGSVVDGPADKPLESLTVTVSGTDISVA